MMLRDCYIILVFYFTLRSISVMLIPEKNKNTGVTTATTIAVSNDTLHESTLSE